ncbi:hypothetical protein D9611_000067 [Ephemerocybe angulata]|uniref:Uncharacterized protein n=1 Tax=Ephemerocybe angulata TaxID=980116 RepID=A0A8H5BMP5_9AGAR|nr:hypothetical protein D9611_000067 [Tulosesus angulatus]
MSGDIFVNFSALDELIQIIYQSIYKFVVVSTVTDEKWTIHLGLSDSDGRWWKGEWTEGNVHEIMGSKPSDKLLEQFGDQLAKLFVDGELFITNWSSAPGAKIKLTVGPAAKTPMHMSLEELTPSQAAEFATGILVDIALQAKSRKCRLHGSTSVFESTPAPTTSRVPTRSDTVEGSSRSSPAKASMQLKTEEGSHVGSSSGPGEKPIKPSHLETVAMQAKSVTSATDKKRAASSETTTNNKPAPVARPFKGASLANPNKKARKYQAIEFESDSE